MSGFACSAVIERDVLAGAFAEGRLISSDFPTASRLHTSLKASAPTEPRLSFDSEGSVWPTIRAVQVYRLKYALQVRISSPFGEGRVAESGTCLHQSLDLESLGHPAWVTPCASAVCRIFAGGEISSTHMKRCAFSATLRKFGRTGSGVTLEEI